MPKPEDLMGTGLPAELSNVLGNAPKSITCAGTTQGTATAIPLVTNIELIPTTSQTGAILNTSSLIGTRYYFFNAAATAVTAKVYAPSGETMNGSLNGSVSIAQNLGAYIWQYKNNTWASVLTA